MQRYNFFRTNYSLHLFCVVVKELSNYCHCNQPSLNTNDTKTAATMGGNVLPIHYDPKTVKQLTKEVCKIQEYIWPCLVHPRINR